MFALHLGFNAYLTIVWSSVLVLFYAWFYRDFQPLHHHVDTTHLLLLLAVVAILLKE